MTKNLFSLESSAVHLFSSLLLALPASFLFAAVKFRHRLKHGSSLLTTPHHQPPMSSPKPQMTEPSLDLDDFDPDDEWCQEWLSILTDDPITFVNTTAHLDRCYLLDGQQPHS